MSCLSLLRSLVLLRVGSCTLTPGDNSQESSQCSPWSGWGEEVEWDFLQLPIAHVPRHFIQPFLFYRSGIMVVRSFSTEPHLLCGPASPKLHLDSKAQVPSALVPSCPGFLSFTFTARVSFPHLHCQGFNSGEGKVLTTFLTEPHTELAHYLSSPHWETSPPKRQKSSSSSSLFQSIVLCFIPSSSGSG